MRAVGARRASAAAHARSRCRLAQSLDEVRDGFGIARCGCGPDHHLAVLLAACVDDDIVCGVTGVERIDVLPPPWWRRCTSYRQADAIWRRLVRVAGEEL